MPSEYIELRNLLEDFAYRAIKEKPSDLISFGLEFFQNIKDKGGKLEPKDTKKCQSSENEDADVVTNLEEVRKNVGDINKNEDIIYQNVQGDEFNGIKKAESNETIYEPVMDDIKSAKEIEDMAEVEQRTPENLAQEIKDVETKVEAEKKESPAKSFLSRFSRQNSGDESKKVDTIRRESASTKASNDASTIESCESVSTIQRRDSSLSRNLATKSPVEIDSGSISRRESVVKTSYDAPSIIRRESIKNSSISPQVEKVEENSNSLNRDSSKINVPESPIRTTETSSVERSNSLSKSFATSNVEQPSSPARSNSLSRSYVAENKEDKLVPKSNAEGNPADKLPSNDNQTSLQLKD